MKNPLLFLGLFLSLFLLSLSAGAAKKELTAQITPLFRPALSAEADNQILCITIDNPTEKETNVYSFSFSFDGTTIGEDISSLTLYCSGKSPLFSSDVPFGNTLDMRGRVTFKAKQVLRPGKNYFWMSLSLKKNADLSGKILCTCTQIKSEEGSIALHKTENSATTIATAVRRRGQEGCHTYRIPGLATTQKGTLIAVYDARWKGAGDLQGDIDVALSRSLDEGRTWLPMQKAIDLGEWGQKPNAENGVGDAAILYDSTRGRAWIAALWQHGKKGQMAWWSSRPGLSPEETGQIVLSFSDDDGVTWSEPRSITPQVKDPQWYLCFDGPGCGITTREGNLVFAAQYKDENQMPHSTILYSKDGGETWHMGKGAKENTTEAQVVELADGSLMLNMRDNRGGARSVAVTKDWGESWEEHPTSRKALIEPVCQGSLLRAKLKEGKEVLCFFNPNDQKERRNLTLKLSFDEGQTWPEEYHTLLYAPSCYGYSCLTQIKEGLLGVLYEGVGDLFFQQIDLEEIVQKGREMN